MQFLVYFEINEGLSAERNQEIAQTLTGEGLFPPEEQELIRWDVTPDGWGVAVVETDDIESLYRGLNLWRTAAGDTAFFEETKTAPSFTGSESISLGAALLEELE